MSAYTEKFEKAARNLSRQANSEISIQELCNTAGDFEPFENRFVRFMNAQGIPVYQPGILNRAFASIGLKKPRNLPAKPISRASAFALCFAFRFDEKTARSFFQKVLLEEYASLRDLEEAVYYCAVRCQFDYRECRSLIEKHGNRSFERNQKQVLDPTLRSRTSSLKKELESVWTLEQLDQFLEEHRQDFDSFSRSFDKNALSLLKTIDQIENSYYSSCSGFASGLNAPDLSGSAFSLLSRMLGLFRYEDEKGTSNQTYAQNGDRLFTSVLDNNPLIAQDVCHSFPSRNNLNKIKNHTLKDRRAQRKFLILLLFYCFWMNEALNHQADIQDSEPEKKFLMNLYLLLDECGFSVLYYGNPYDWLFLYSIQAEDPLDAFWSFMQEVYNIWNENRELFENEEPDLYPDL